MGRISGQRGRRGEQWIERETSGAIRRVRNRARGEKKPDFEPWRHPTTGVVYVFESKYGAAAEPKKVRAAISQAEGYAAGAIGVAVFRNVGATDAIACLPLAALLRLLDLLGESGDGQLLL